MQILFGGVRGSSPRAESEFAVYGGHTTCLLVVGTGGEHLLLDAGSGVHTVNRILASRPALDLLVLFSHLHLDHVLGLPLLVTLFDPASRVELASVSHAHDGPRQALERLLAPPLWPFGLDTVPAAVTFLSIPPETLDATEPALTHGGLEIRGCALPHPNGCTAWRVDEPATGASFVFATDMEWAAAGSRRRGAILSLCRGTDLLVMDGQFSAAELSDHEGWGHSSLDDCLEVAREAGAGRLLATHHNPVNDDARLATLDRDLQAAWSGAALARQGDTVVLDGIHREGRDNP